MKKSRRVLAILICFAMAVSVAVVASAATSKTFFITESGGYTCKGYGNLEDYKGTATFVATPPLEGNVIPKVDCESTVYVLAFDSYGDRIGATTTTGDISATAVYYSGSKINEIYCTFEFNGVSFGGYILSAD